MESAVKNQVWIQHHRLVQMVSYIETHLPGWWYSLSQKDNILFMSMGPTSACPDPESLYLSSTKEGDSGYRYEISLVEHSDDESDVNQAMVRPILVEFKNHISNLKKMKNELIPNKNVVIRTRSEFARRHSQNEFSHLNNIYLKLIDYLKFIERNHPDTFIVRQIYLGTCALSSDCSIRGIRGDGTEFDITCDMTGAAMLGNSLEAALNMLEYFVKHEI